MVCNQPCTAQQGIKVSKVTVESPSWGVDVRCHPMISQTCSMGFQIQGLIRSLKTWNVLNLCDVWPGILLKHPTEWWTWAMELTVWFHALESCHVALNDYQQPHMIINCISGHNMPRCPVCLSKIMPAKHPFSSISVDEWVWQSFSMKQIICHWARLCHSSSKCNL